MMMDEAVHLFLLTMNTRAMIQTVLPPPPHSPRSRTTTKVNCDEQCHPHWRHLHHWCQHCQKVTWPQRHPHHHVESAPPKASRQKRPIGPRVEGVEKEMMKMKMVKAVKQ